MRVLSLNGPNLNLLGTREPGVYGATTLAELTESLSAWGEELGVEIDHFQSNHEGDLIQRIQDSDHDGIIFNPGALTHTSRALADAVSAIGRPVVEVHISNVKEREAWRSSSVLAGVAAFSIYGRGVMGYRHAIRHLVNRASFDSETIRYGPHQDNVGDLRRGGSGSIVLVHGGFWRHEWARDTMESLAVDLASRGHNTWNIEYRRIGTGGGWPGSAQDVQMALDFAPQLGLDAHRLTVIGHSAGGHLALWAGQRSATGVELMVGLAPVTDLAVHASSGLYGAGEAQMLLDSGAPSQVSPGDVPTLLIHGNRDDHVPLEQSSSLAASHDLRLVEVPSGHFDLLDPRNEHWEQVLAAISGS